MREWVSQPSIWARLRGALSPARQNTSGAERHRAEPGVHEGVGEFRATSNPRLVRSQRLDEAFGTAWNHSRLRKVSLSVILLEVDRFKDYGRAYGQDAAEACLVQMKRAILENLPRQDDFLGRQGRSVFVALLPDYPLLMARATAQKIATSVAEAGMPHKESHRGLVTVSIGVAVTNPAAEPDRAFLTVAQAALDKAKAKGLSRIETIDLRKPEHHRLAS